MRADWFGHTAAAATLVVGLSMAGTAFTQPADTGTSQAGAKAELGVQTKPVITPEQQAAEAQSMLKSGQALAERLGKMLDEARIEKDIMRANCINRKLTETNANVRNVDQRVRAHKDATAAGDEARRNHEFTVLSVLSQKLSTLKTEAAQCLGQSLFEPGASQVITTVAAGNPTLNPIDIGSEPTAPAVFLVPPPIDLSGPVSPLD
jgi:hypothetical protein